MESVGEKQGIKEVKISVSLTQNLASLELRTKLLSKLKHNLVIICMYVCIFIDLNKSEVWS